MDPSDLPDIPLLRSEIVGPLPMPQSTMHNSSRSTPKPRPEVPHAMPIPRPETPFTMPPMIRQRRPQIPRAMHERPAPRLGIPRAVPIPRSGIQRTVPTPRPGLPRVMQATRPEFRRLMPMATPVSSRAILRPVFPRPIPTHRQEYSYPLSMPASRFARPITGPRPEYVRSMPRIQFIRNVPGTDIGGMPAAAPELTLRPSILEQVHLEMPPLIRYVAPTTPQNIATMMGLDQPTDDDTDDNDDMDEGMDMDNETADGQSTAKRSRKEDTFGGTENNNAEDNNGEDGDSAIVGQSKQPNNSNRDVLPDLPQPKPMTKRRPGQFTAQEHTFLAWAKTMSTFTAKRQATIKMKINKIMSEAEFEDLDDEFFAGNLKKGIRSSSNYVLKRLFLLLTNIYLLLIRSISNTFSRYL